MLVYICANIDLPSPERYGWTLAEDGFKPVTITLPYAPVAINHLVQTEGRTPLH